MISKISLTSKISNSNRPSSIKCPSSEVKRLLIAAKHSKMVRKVRANLRTDSCNRNTHDRNVKPVLLPVFWGVGFVRPASLGT
jgi:hypothetical protein